jgi:ferredoxin-NADP reductase
LAQGEVQDGVVTCPWHGWTFNVCSGCSLSPPGNDLATYAVKIDEGNVYVAAREGGREAARVALPAGEAAPATASPPGGPLKNSPLPLGEGASVAVFQRAAGLPAPRTALLPVVEVIEETHDTKTFRLDNSKCQLAVHRAGQFVKVCVPVAGGEVWRSFTLSSSPARAEVLALTVKRNPAGEVSSYLHDRISAGSELKIKGPLGGFYFDPFQHTEPLVLVSAGSGVTPMLAIARYLADTQATLPVVFLHGARSEADIIGGRECLRLAERLPGLRYHVALSQPAPAWSGLRGRLSIGMIRDLAPNLARSRFFVCGPASFNDDLTAALLAAGVAAGRIHTEQFHKSQF